jgi:cell wall-associated NlpC family hydrolase
MGTTFKHQGRVKGAGIDCVGLIICAGHELGIYHDDYVNYPRFPDQAYLLKCMRETLDEKEIKNIEHGDVLLFKIGGLTQHTGIYCVEDGVEYVLHAYEPAGAVVMHQLTDVWKRKIAHAFGYKF